MSTSSVFGVKGDNGNGLVRRMNNVPVVPHITLEDLLITPEDALYWEQHPEEMKQILGRSLSRSKPIKPKIIKRTLIPFITIETGGMTREQLISDIETMPAEVSNRAKNIMSDEAVFHVSQEVGTADLVLLTPADLGFTGGPLMNDFITPQFCASFSGEYLKDCAIELCKLGDGPQLRKRWKDQPERTMVWMAMEPILDSGKRPHVFRVGRSSDGARWLYAFWVRELFRWDLTYSIMFRFRML